MRNDPTIAGGRSVKKKTSSGWSSGNKTGKTAAQKASERKKAEYRGAEGPKKSSPRPARSGVGKGGGRGVAMNKPSAKKRGK
jgi:hypothetical protein